MNKLPYELIALLLGIVAIVSVITCSARPSQDDVTWDELRTCVHEKECLIDSMSTHFPFDDTIGETDEYATLQDALVKFNDSQSLDEANAYYDMYQRAWTQVYWQCIDQIQKIDNPDSVPVNNWHE